MPKQTPASSARNSLDKTTPGGETRARQDITAPTEERKRIAQLEFQVKQLEQDATKRRREENERDKKRQQEYDDQQKYNRVAASNQIANTHNIKSLVNYTESIAKAVNNNSVSIGSANAPVRAMWKAYKSLTQPVNRLNPRLQGRLGGKFALPSTSARLAIGAPAGDEQNANNDDDGATNDDDGANNDENEDDADYVDMTGDEEESTSSSKGGNGRRRSKGKGKGPRKQYRH